MLSEECSKEWKYRTRKVKLHTYSCGSEIWRSNLYDQNSVSSRYKAQHVLEASICIWTTSKQLVSVTDSNIEMHNTSPVYLGILLPSSASFADDAVSESENWISAYIQETYIHQQRQQFNSQSLTIEWEMNMTWNPAVFSKVAILWTKPKAEKTWTYKIQIVKETRM